MAGAATTSKTSANAASKAEQAAQAEKNAALIVKNSVKLKNEAKAYKKANKKKLENVFEKMEAMFSKICRQGMKRLKKSPREAEDTCRSLGLSFVDGFNEVIQEGIQEGIRWLFREILWKIEEEFRNENTSASEDDVLEHMKSVFHVRYQELAFFNTICSVLQSIDVLDGMDLEGDPIETAKSLVSTLSILPFVGSVFGVAEQFLYPTC